MRPDQILLSLLALAIVIGVPLVIVALFDLFAGRFDDIVRETRVQRFEEPWRARQEHRRNLRALKHPAGMPIERLGSDLRRLRRLIRQSGDRASAVHYDALRQAYDKVLCDTCAMLELIHELDRPTTGLERDIERVRVEALLEGRGVVISDTRRHGQNA